jgi:hypothetical protein
MPERINPFLLTLFVTELALTSQNSLSEHLTKCRNHTELTQANMAIGPFSRR